MTVASTTRHRPFLPGQVILDRYGWTLYPEFDANSLYLHYGSQAVTRSDRNFNGTGPLLVLGAIKELKDGTSVLWCMSPDGRVGYIREHASDWSRW